VGVAVGLAVIKESHAGSLEVDVGSGGKLLVETRPSDNVLAVKSAVPRLHTSAPLSSS
jgi:hypothetical protein